MEAEPTRTVKLPAWEAKVERGEMMMREEQGENGHRLLHIHAPEAGVGSWRTRLSLEEGRYRFQGMAKAQGLKLTENDPKSGVGLRISRRKLGRKLPGDTDWAPLSFDFEVAPENSGEVELVCELRAERGDAWFDLATLQLIKRP